MRGTLAGISVGAAQNALGNAQFGTAAQPLSTFEALGEGIVKLG